VTRRRSAAEQADLEERILAANVRATQACRDHDVTAEWEAECEWLDLMVERDALLPPPQRKPVDP
jgi:hypothetical protein